MHRIAGPMLEYACNENNEDVFTTLRNARAQEAGLGISYQVSCGNEADLDATDFMRFMLDDEHTNVLLVAIETVRDGRKFAEVARYAAEREKPLVMLKFGRTDAGRRAAAASC